MVLGICDGMYLYILVGKNDYCLMEPTWGVEWRLPVLVRLYLGVYC